MSMRELYQQVIVDHGCQPRNTGCCENATCMRDGYNPLCGDKLTVSMRLCGDRIADIKFQGEGCAISMASASLMTEALLGKSKTDALALFEQFHQLLTDGSDVDEEMLDKLAVFSGVREYPMRVKCATLAWHTMKSLWDGKVQKVSTE
jgi:nitrogen fixation protein NifU and related proteins